MAVVNISNLLQSEQTNHAVFQKFKDASKLDKNGRDSDLSLAEAK